MPVAQPQIGSLSASNIMTLCANHHREMHYGRVDVVITEKSFNLTIGGKTLRVPRLRLETLSK